MTDLVEKVARITSDCRAYEELTGQLWEAHYVTARAAIAAVLDDLAEPSDAEWEAYKQRKPMVGSPEALAKPEFRERYYARLRHAFENDRQAMLTAKRKEMGL